MIKITDQILKKQENFWNQCLFHPTDAIEDSWGKRILDRMAQDKAVQTVRIYTMLEDIVYTDENGKLQYDFRLSDLRLDYLLEKGYEILLAYAGMPDCIAASVTGKTSVSKNKTRYKGKLFNTSAPKDYSLWEEVCYEYTRHNVERYGLDTAAKWYCQCFNEPDIPAFFLSELPASSVKERLLEYCRLYEAFQRGIRRVSEKIPVGGPALAGNSEFLGGWLDDVRQKNLKLDFISLHNYGTDPISLNHKTEQICVENNIRKHRNYLKIIADHGFQNTPIVIDEWGAATNGFYNREDCPDLMFRETEVFSAYFVKLIYELVYSDFKIAKLMICLSGQHEMTEDFSGFRNFFTLHFIAKPIYNAYILASGLEENFLKTETVREDLFVLPTKSKRGDYAILLTYASQNFKEDIPKITETLEFQENIEGREVTIWRIDRHTTNPYRLYEQWEGKSMTEEQAAVLRKEGTLHPVKQFVFSRLEEHSGKIRLSLTPNAVYLICVKGH